MRLYIMYLSFSFCNIHFFTFPPNLNFDSGGMYSKTANLTFGSSQSKFIAETSNNLPQNNCSVYLKKGSHPQPSGGENYLQTCKSALNDQCNKPDISIVPEKNKWRVGRYFAIRSAIMVRVGTRRMNQKWCKLHFLLWVYYMHVCLHILGPHGA